MKKISTPNITICTIFSVLTILIVTYLVANSVQNSFVEGLFTFAGIALIFVVGGFPGFIGLYRKEFTTVDLRRVITGKRAVRISWMWLIIWYSPLLFLIIRVIQNSIR